MKKTVLLLLSFALVLTLGAFARAQEQTPPPAKPVAAAAPPAAVKPGVAIPAVTPQAAPVAMTAPAAIAPTAGPAPAAKNIAPAMPIEQTPPPREAAAATPTSPVPAQAQTAPPAKPEKPPVLRTELIHVKYADAMTVYSLFQAYKSRWGNVSPTGIMARGTEYAIVVTDTPEIVEKMLGIVREIDIKPAEIQFTVQLIQGMEAEGTGDDALKNDPLIRELRSVLRYRSFSLLDGTLMRVIDGNESETKFGPKGEYTINLMPKYVKDGAAETIQTRIRLRKPEWISQRTTKTETKEETQSMQMYYNDLIGTTLQLKAGEKTVVGVSKSDADKGLILILSAKVIK